MTSVAPRRRGKDIPRLPLSAFSPPNTSASDTFPIPPTPSLITPSAVVDAHLHVGCHVAPSQRRAVVLAPAGQPAAAVESSTAVEARVLAVLVPFILDSAPPEHADALTTVYDGATSIVPEAEDGKDQPVETPVQNLRWALQHARVVDIDVKGGVMDTDVSFYDSFVNLLAKAIKSGTKPTPIVLTNVLPPPLDSVSTAVTIMNQPTYATYRHRVSLLSLSENVSVKLLPPAWVPSEPIAALEEMKAKQFRDVLKLFIVPVLEAFGFERIVFGSSSDQPSRAENWYQLVLESFRELAVSQDEMDKIFVENAERVYGST